MAVKFRGALTVRGKIMTKNNIPLPPPGQPPENVNPPEIYVEEE